MDVGIMSLFLVACLPKTAQNSIQEVFASRTWRVPICMCVCVRLSVFVTRYGGHYLVTCTTIVYYVHNICIFLYVCNPNSRVALSLSGYRASR